MKKQFFISSTYQDLKEERQNIVQLLLRAGHIPAGMELFRQDDRRQWETIKEWIDASDVVITITKDRYGSICKDTGISYTEMEYDYAVSSGKTIIRIVYEEIDEEKCDDIEKLRAFREKLLRDNVTPMITNETEMAERIIQGIRKVEKKSELSRYELMQYLMFGTDRAERGFNLFTIAPKVMMALDMTREYNKVEIERLDIWYAIKSGDRCSEDIFDCERKWSMRTIRNVGDKELSQYSFYTATDIGEREDADVRISNCINEQRQVLRKDSYKNGGVSCWRWDIEPHLPVNGMLDDMVISEPIVAAWDFCNRLHEIVYFIPKCFGTRIGTISFSFDADKDVPPLEMDLYKISQKNGRTRQHIGRLASNVLSDGKRRYGVSIDNREDVIDMDALYYILLKKQDSGGNEKSN